MKHFETKFASTDFKVNLLNLKKIFLEKNRFFKKLIRNFNLPNNNRKSELRCKINGARTQRAELSKTA